jgi:hypothetical protein
MSLFSQFIDDLKLGLYSYYCGVCGALTFRRAFEAVWNSSTIRKLMFKCFLLNGLLFLGSILLFEYALKPILLFATASLSRLAFGGAALDADNAVLGSSLLQTAFSLIAKLLYYVRDESPHEAATERKRFNDEQILIASL